MKSLEGAPFSERPERRSRDLRELGHPAPISFLLGRNDVLSIGVTGFICYRNGFEFRLIVVFASQSNRLSPLRSMNERVIAAAAGEPLPDESNRFRLAVTFAGGSRVDSYSERSVRRTVTSEQTSTPSLGLLEGASSGLRSDLTWFVTPLPPPGPIIYECIWPEAGTMFRHEIDATDQILTAAKHSLYMVQGPID
jgi:hypothetical protein